MDSLHRLDLRIVATERVHPHEIADPGRERRIEGRLRDDGQLRDPLMVGTVPEFDGFVLLDGTNRQRALANLGFPNVLVQVIDYTDEHALELRTWSHAATRPLAELVSGMETIPGVTVNRLPELASADALRASSNLALVLDDRDQYECSRLPNAGISRADQLRRLVDLYEDGLVRIDCAAEEIEERAHALLRAAAGRHALIAFPPFSRSQVVTMAMRGALIPAGITRHIIHAGRALRVNIPLKMLADREPDAALGRHLATLQPRVYLEPTILFDS